MSLDPFAIRDVLCYDSITQRTLTVGQRITVHQHLGQHKAIPAELQIKLANLHKRILEEKWEAPVVRYDEDFNIEIINPKD